MGYVISRVDDENGRRDSATVKAVSATLVNKEHIRMLLQGIRGASAILHWNCESFSQSWHTNESSAPPCSAPSLSP